MANNHRLLQNFEKSTEVASSILNKYCDQPFKKKNEFYELIITNAVLENENASEIKRIEKDFAKCKIDEKMKSQIQSEVFSLYINTDQFTNVLEYLQDNTLSESNLKLVKTYFQFKFWQAPQQNIEEFRKISSKYPQLFLSKTFTDYDSLVAYKEKVSLLKFVFTVSEKFNDEIFNNELDQYLAIVNELTNDAVKLAKISSPEVVLELQNIVTLPYKSLQNAILNFHPKGVDESYLKGFVTGMRQISESLTSKILQFDREKLAFFDKNHFFFEVKNHAKFGNEKMNVDQILAFHTAALHSQTVELTAKHNK
jgi:hypothetical protein